MKKNKMLGAALLAVASSPLLAADFSYTYLEGGYVQLEDDANSEADGYGIRGSLEIGEGAVIEASYSKVDYDEILGQSLSGTSIDVEQDGYGLFIGGIADLDKTSAKIGAFYEDGKIEVNGAIIDRADTMSYGLTADFRAWLVEKSIEGDFGLGVASTEVDNEENTGALVRLGLRAYLMPQLSIGLALERDMSYEEDTDTLLLTLRFSN